MPNHTSIYKIMKDEVDIYNAEKHRLPCWNCVVRPTCFSEKKATKRAKDLRYTLNFKDPCIELILAIKLLNLANSDHSFPLEMIDKKEIPELFDTAVILYHSDRFESKIAGCVMFICVVQRDSNYIRPENYTAYHYLGYVFHEIFKEIDHAIELYSMGIELTPEEPSIIENRGFCFLIKNDLQNALDDFERAKGLDGGCHPDLANIIDDIKNRQKGLKGSSNCYQRFKNPPKSPFPLNF